jgi:phage gp37-like protein
MKGTPIHEIEAALLARLKSRLAGVQVAGLTAEDFDEHGDLIVEPPAALVAFQREGLDPRMDGDARTYISRQNFVVLCGARNMRGTADERVSALELVEQASVALAGARLLIPSSQQGPAWALLRGVEMVKFDERGTWYALRVEIESVAQFAEVA